MAQGRRQVELPDAHQGEGAAVGHGAAALPFRQSQGQRLDGRGRPTVQVLVYRQGPIVEAHSRQGVERHQRGHLRVGPGRLVAMDLREDVAAEQLPELERIVRAEEALQRQLVLGEHLADFPAVQQHQVVALGEFHFDQRGNRFRLLMAGGAQGEPRLGPFRRRLRGAQAKQDTSDDQ